MKKVSKKKNIRKKTTIRKRINTFILAITLTGITVQSFEMNAKTIDDRNLRTVSEETIIHEPEMISEVKCIVGVEDNIYNPMLLGLEINKMEETIKGLNNLLIDVILDPYSEDSRVKLDAYKFITENININTDEILYLDDEYAVTKVMEGRTPYTYYRGADIHILGRIPEGYITFNGILDYSTELVSKDIFEERDRERRKVVAKWNVTSDSNMTYEKVEKLVEGTFLDGAEEAIYRAEEEYGIDPLFTYAVACLESDYGRSPIARDKNNLYGMNAEDDDPYNKAYYYDSKSESIEDFIERIDKYYVSQGYTDIDDINRKYSSDSNWHIKVYAIMNEGANKINSN